MGLRSLYEPVAAGHQAGPLRRGWPSWVAGGTAVALVVGMAFDSGGYFPPSYLAAGAIAFATLGVLLLVRPPHYRISTRGLAGLAALAGLTAWTALSAAWSVSADAALEAAQRDLAYLGLFGLALVAAGSGRYAGLLVWGVLGAIVVIGVAGLITRVYPDLMTGPVSPLATYRLSYPISYWNAYGTLCAMGAVLGIGLAGDPRTPAILRGLSVGASIALAVAIYFSLSRGAWLAAILALVLLLSSGPRRGSLLLSTVVVAGATALLILRLRHYPALVDDPRAGMGQLREGHAFARELLGVAVVAGVLGIVLGAARGPVLRLAGGLAPGRPVKAAFAVLCAGLALGGGAVEAGRIGDFATRQWSDFVRPAVFGPAGPARLLNVKGTRSDVYRVALDGFAANPVIGAGAGSFQSRWLRDRRVAQQLVNAHSLELETLDELGSVGGLLLLAFVGSVAAAAVRARSTPGSLTSVQAAAVTAAVTVWLIDSAVDWDWQIGALTGLAIVLAATLYPFGRARRRHPGRGRVPSAAVADRPSRAAA